MQKINFFQFLKCVEGIYYRVKIQEFFAGFDLL